MTLRLGAIALIFMVYGCVVEVHDHRQDQPPPPPPPDQPVVVQADDGPPPPPPDAEGDVTTQEWYHRVPERRGYLDEYLPPNGGPGEVHLEPGRYHLKGIPNRIRFNNGGLRIIGSGANRTFIEGDVIANGNGYAFKELTITGDLTIRGDDCELFCYVRGRKEIHGRIHTQWRERPRAYDDSAPPPPPPQQPPVVVAPQPQPQQPQPQPQNGGGGIPNMGHLDQYLPAGFKGEVFLKPGVYTLRDGKIKFGGGGLSIRGSGKQNTYIKGDMSFHGDGFVMMGFTVDGDVEVRGNNNVGDINIRGHKDIKGGNNKGW